jgi:transposase
MNGIRKTPVRVSQDEVLRLIGEGRSKGEVAEMLNIHVSTVGDHIRRARGNSTEATVPEQPTPGSDVEVKTEPKPKPEVPPELKRGLPKHDARPGVAEIVAVDEGVSYVDVLRELDAVVRILGRESGVDAYGVTKVVANVACEMLTKLCRAKGVVWP